MIEKVLHQIWFQGEKNLPSRYVEMRREWMFQHPDWLHICWDEASIRALIEEHYSQYLTIYDRLNKMILKIDFAKYLILHRYGGVYLDVDVECLKPIDPLFDGSHTLYISEMKFYSDFSLWVTSWGKLRKGPCWNNHFLASVKAHPFWLELVSEIGNSLEKFYPTNTLRVLNVTGPLMLSYVLRTRGYLTENTQSLPNYIFEPCDKFNRHGTDLSRSYGIHTCDNNWMGLDMKIISYFYFKPKVFFSILVLVSAIFAVILKR